MSAAQRDDRPSRAVRLVRRRDVLLAACGAGLGATALALPVTRRTLGALATPSSAYGQATCTLSPEQTEGPFHVEDPLLRRNVVEDRVGVPLWVTLRVVRADGCTALPGAVVEIWHADANGDYSGFGAPSERRFLRGQQIVGDAGAATFRTIYPGWYPGRAVHIHVKVHVGGSELHTGQLYFDDALSDRVLAREPYSARGPRSTRNADDGIFARGGAESMLDVAARGDGYWGAITLVVAPS